METTDLMIGDYVKVKPSEIMITEDYCSYEVSELLKQKACDEIMFSSYQPKYNKDGTSIIYSTCSHQVAMAFLRKKKGIARHSNNNKMTYEIIYRH